MPIYDKFCDDCLDAAYDMGIDDDETMDTILSEMGADIADHTCESVEFDRVCGCACKLNR